MPVWEGEFDFHSATAGPLLPDGEAQLEYAMLNHTSTALFNEQDKGGMLRKGVTGQV